MSLSGVELKQKMGRTEKNIRRDIAATLSDDYVMDQIDNQTSDADQNKIELLNFVTSRVNELINSDPGTVAYLGRNDQFINLKKVRYFTHPNQKKMDGTTSRDFFDLEKSFQAYRLLYPANSHQPMRATSYYLFKDVRDTRLRQFGVNFKGYVEEYEIENFKNELDGLFDKTRKHFKMNKEGMRADRKEYLSGKLKEMQENSHGVYQNVNTQAICNDENVKPRYEAALAYGYTAFALGHLTGDANIAIEKRCFLVEQTGRVLHHLAHNA